MLIQFHIIMRMLLNGQRFLSPTIYHNDYFILCLYLCIFIHFYIEITTNA